MAPEHLPEDDRERVTSWLQLVKISAVVLQGRLDLRTIRPYAGLHGYRFRHFRRPAAGHPGREHRPCSRAGHPQRHHLRIDAARRQIAEVSHRTGRSAGFKRAPASGGLGLSRDRSKSSGGQDTASPAAKNRGGCGFSAGVDHRRRRGAQTPPWISSTRTRAGPVSAAATF